MSLLFSYAMAMTILFNWVAPELSHGYILQLSGSDVTDGSSMELAMQPHQNPIYF
jgi:hypothetical protein